MSLSEFNSNTNKLHFTVNMHSKLLRSTVTTCIIAQAQVHSISRPYIR